MAQMNISIPEALKSWAEARVAEGSYSSTSDYVRDLVRRDRDYAEKLKALLHADTVDGGAVKALVMKLGKETVALATKAGGDTTNKADAKTAEQIKHLGEALEGAARA